MDAANGNAGAAPAAAAPAAAAPAAAVVGGANQRLRFHVELTPGETTVVSWKQLMRDAGNEVSDDSSEETDSDDYIQVQKSRIKKSCSLVNREKVQHKTRRNEPAKSSNDRTKKRTKEIMNSVGEEDDARVDNKHKKKGNRLIKTAAKTAISVDRNSKSQVFNVQNGRCNGNFKNPLNSSVGVSLTKHFDSSSKLDCLLFAKELERDASGFPAKKLCSDKKGFASDPRDPGNNIISSVTSAAHQKLQEKKSAHHDLHSRSSMSKDNEEEGFTNIKQLNKKVRNELPDLNLPCTGHARITHIMNSPKSGEKMIDWSILQLEKLVETSKTPLIEVQGADASLLEIEKQLPPELKEKLAKVARLTQLNEGKISEELIDRLMGILGKYLQRKILKKILREMVLEDLFASKAECNYFKQMKKDIVEMIRLQAPSLYDKVYPASEVYKGIYSMDDQLEDKLCDLYDAFAQGLDEDIGRSLVRKLYVKLAELWPKGAMDKHGIRTAICQAKERKTVLSSKEKGHQETKKGKLFARTDETIRGKACSVTQTPAAHQHVITDTSGLTQTSAKRRMVSSMPSVVRPLTAPSGMSKIPSKSLYRNPVRSGNSSK